MYHVSQYSTKSIYVPTILMSQKRKKKVFTNLRITIIVTNYRICKILLIILCNILLFMFHGGFCLLWTTSNIYTVAIISITLENILYLIAWSQCIGKLIIQLMDGSAINRSSSIKYLGVIIDHKLNWCEHISYLMKRS